MNEARRHPQTENGARGAEQRALIVRSLLALPCALVPLVFVNLRANGFFPAALDELVYLAALASVHGAVIGGGLFVLGWIDRLTPHKRGVWSLLALLVATSPLTYALGEHTALTDGLRARGYSPALLASCSMLVAVAALTLAWLYQRYAFRSRWVYWAGIPGLLILAWIELSFGRKARYPALLLNACEVMLLAQTLATPLIRTSIARPRFAVLTAGFGAALVLAVAGMGVMAETPLREGRRRVLVRASHLPHLDRAAMFDEPFVGHRLSRAVAAPCPTPAPAATPPVALGQEQRRNVLFITMDTVRGDDALGSVDGRPIMPHLSQFMAESWRAPHAYSAYPATMLSLTSAFSGLLPSRTVLTSTPPPSVFGALRGYMDEISVILPEEPYFRRPALEYMVTQGAERIVARDVRTQVQTTITTLASLRKRGERHLLWLHIFEPHAPYQQHGPHDFGPSARDRYRSELAAVDVELGKLFDFLREQRAYDDTLVMVFSDHGESFGEHGHQYHMYHLYPWLIRIPFAMRVPGQAPRMFEGPVHLTDVAATVFDFVGIPPQLELDGQSLLRTEPDDDRVIISEEFALPSSLLAEYARTPVLDAESLEERLEGMQYSPGYDSKVSVIKGDFQLVLHPGTNVHTLHRLDDPLVEQDLSPREPEKLRELRDELERYYARVSRSLGCIPGGLRAAKAP